MLLATLAVAAADGKDVPPGESADRRLRERGQRLYTLYCADCHGPQGQGDGPMAVDQETPPSDLTTLAKAAGGVFPLMEAYEVIDGRGGPSSHQRGAMPVWGLMFQEPGMDANQDDEVRGRILQILHFLKSIQVEDVPPPQP